MAKGAHCKGGAIMRMIWDRVGGMEGRKDLLHRYYRTEGVCFSTRHWHLAICFKGCTNRGTQIGGRRRIPFDWSCGGTGNGDLQVSRVCYMIYDCGNEEN